MAERILAAFCKPPEEVSYDDPMDDTVLAKRAVPEDPLKDLRRDFPNLAARLRNRAHRSRVRRSRDGA